MEKKTIGNFISVLRRANGMTQKQLGEMLYVSDKTVSRWERDECTPELSLIPAIAEIFGITTDELLRGERNAQVREVEDEAGAARRRARSDKQFRSMMHHRLTKYKNFSLLSVGLTAGGVIFAMVFNLGLLEGVLGFCVASIFLVGALICQICFASNAVMPLEDEDEGREAQIREMNNEVVLIKLRVFLTIAAAFAFVLPLVLFVWNGGLTLDSWLLTGGILVGLTLIAGYMLYVFWLRGRMVRSDSLVVGEAELERMQQEKRLLRRMFAISVMIAVVLFGGIFMLEAAATDPRWLANSHTFDNYEDFQEFMLVGSYNKVSGDDMSSVEELEAVIAPENMERMEELNLYVNEFRDADGNLLCEYVSNPWFEYAIEPSFDQSKDGLPIRVYTSDDIRSARHLLGQIQIGLGALMIVEVVVCAGIFLVRRKRDLQL